MKRYRYGMRSPDRKPPDGLIECEDDVMQEYLSILVYDRRLTAEEVAGYDLDYIRCEVV